MKILAVLVCELFQRPEPRQQRAQGPRVDGAVEEDDLGDVGTVRRVVPAVDVVHAVYVIGPQRPHGGERGEGHKGFEILAVVGGGGAEEAECG